MSKKRTYMALPLVEIYQHPRYMHLADQLENHQLAAKYILQELTKEFPPITGDAWEVFDNRPVIMRKARRRK